MYRIMGINDDKDTCELCGRSELKRVVWIQEYDQDNNSVGEAHHYGTSCADIVLGLNSTGTKAQKERKLNDLAIEHKKELRADYFETKCFLTPDNIYIEKGYKIGQVMKEQQIDRLSAVAYIKEQMRLNNWFLR